MANTYTLISSNTLSASAASVTFSSIPSTYTDLVLKCSVRTTQAAVKSNIKYTFNGVSGTSYSSTSLNGDGATATSTAAVNDSNNLANFGAAGSTATTNTFGNTEIYIPSYLASQKKPSNAMAASETNATSAFMSANANLFNDTTAISSITFTPSGGSFDTGSSFYLYGIKNS